MLAVGNDQVSRSATAEASAEALWGEHGRRVWLLGRLPLFQEVGPTALAHLATALQPHAAAAGTIIFREGEPVDRFFLVVSGTLVASVVSGGARREVARLAAGDFFGEVALLGVGQATTTVRAETDTQLWALADEELHELCRRVPQIGATLLRARQLRLGDERRAQLAAAGGNLATLVAGGHPLRIGRAIDNELALPSPAVARHHALIEPTGAGYRLRNLDALGATWVNGLPVGTVELRDGDALVIGDQPLLFDRRASPPAAAPRGIRITAQRLSRRVGGGRAILDDISLSIGPGELVAIIGGSGVGKSTLLDALAGVRPATGGTVAYDDDDLYANLARYRPLLGYVPQDDIIHTALPLRRTLRHAARLRLPPGTPEAEIATVVAATLDVLGLAEEAATRVGALSGGQRKRCSIGVELLTRPRACFLDEPTSGLDPANEAQLMRLLRRLADGGSTVVLTTHATSALASCDKVVVLARGGALAFVGSPQGALRHFAAGTFDAIYARLAEDGAATWAERFRAAAETRVHQLSRPADRAAARSRQPGEAFGRRLRRGVRQCAALTGRSGDLLLHSRASLASLVLPPLLIIFLLLALFPPGAFGPAPDPAVALQTTLILGYGALFVGLATGLQEIVKELAIFRRERGVGLGIVPYLVSKLATLAPIVMLHMLVLTGVLRLTDRLPAAGWGVYGRLLPSLGLNALIGLALGLLISAAVPSPEVATRLQSLVLIPQFLFSGGLVAVAAMGDAGRAISAGTALRWGFEGLARALDLNAYFAASDTPAGHALLAQYGETFAGGGASRLLIVAGFSAGALLLTGLILHRKGTAA